MSEIIQEWSVGTVRSILDRCLDPLTSGLKNMAKDQWIQFKTDFDLAFSRYLRNAYDKYSGIKTQLYRYEPQYLYDFFVAPYLKRASELYSDACADIGHKKGRDERIRTDNIFSILNISNYIIIQGDGGIGKSTLMKHIFLQSIKGKEYIPVFLELRDFSFDSDMSIEDYVIKSICSLGNEADKPCIEYALKSGYFLFLLDGYDEMVSGERVSFMRKMEVFLDSFPDNHYIISSRPFSEFIEWQRFTVLSACPFDKSQAISLVEKLRYDISVKNRFLDALRNGLYSHHRSFASNPLLLTIMLLTFDNYAEIPAKLHLFYSSAFEVMFIKHDASKSGFQREIHSSLSLDDFKLVFSVFCFISYTQEKYTFTHEEIVETFKKILNWLPALRFNVADFLFDLQNAVCVLYKDGYCYRFTHRSFQEYFAAYFLMLRPDEEMEKLGKALIFKTPERVCDDNVFIMLKDMAKERYEDCILLPVLRDFELNIDADCRYDSYCVKLFDGLRDISSQFSNTSPGTHSHGRVAVISPNDSRIGAYGLQGVSYFLYRAALDYTFLQGNALREKNAYGHKLVSYIWTVTRFRKKHYLSMREIIENPKLFRLFKRTNVGIQVSILTTLRKYLEEKKDGRSKDLLELLNF